MLFPRLLPSLFISAMSNVCYDDHDVRVGCYDANHTRDDMNAQFAAKSTVSISVFDPNFKVNQASFQVYKHGTKTFWELIMG
jgi:hypothetical protein